MSKFLTYKTSYFSDHYKILRDSIQIGKLYKTEWLGSIIETTINDRNFKFISKGSFRPVISIFDKKTSEIIGTVKISNFFKFSPTATLEFVDDQNHYYWRTKGVLLYNWQWLNATNKVVLVSSNERLKLFKQNGTISTTEHQNEKVELLITLGIHLRNLLQRKTLITRAIGLILIIEMSIRLWK